MNKTSIYTLAQMLLRNAVVLTLLPLAAAASAAAFALVHGSTWVAESRFMPNKSEDTATPVAGIAAQLGISVGGSSGESIDFYGQLVRSPTLLREALAHTFTVNGRAETLEQLLAVKGDNERERTTNGVQMLQDAIQVIPDARSNLLAVRVSMRNGVLAEQVNQLLLDLVSKFNLDKRRTSAAVERSFVEARMRQAQADLRSAEAELEAFHSQNARYDRSPRLTGQEARLQRTVELRQELYVSLAQAFEKARIDEVRNTPIITIVDSPEDSAHPTSGGPVQMTVLGGILGIVLSVIIVITREVLARQKRAFPSDYEAFVQSLRRMKRPRAGVIAS